MRVLLVDHDSDAIENITRAIRGVLELDCVTSKGDALLLLRQNTYDVLIACERCVDGSGLDLLGRTARTTAPLKRIFAAAPERLQLLGPRLAPFKVQRTINYPIDLEELWLAIAQVTSGPNDETDGTIERVVLDERGIPASGSAPRAPIPPRPPAPLSSVSAATAPVITAAGGRAATARLTQPAPEPPLRAPPPPRQPPPAVRAPAPPRSPSDTGRMLRPRIPSAPTPAPPPMTAAGPADFPAWTPETSAEDDFQEIAAQARFGVQQKVVDEASRRKRMRLFAAGGIAIVVAGAIVLLIEKFYDPAASARKEAIAAQVQQMAEQQKVTDDLTLIEMDIENAIIANDFAKARQQLADLVEKSPNHPRRDFLEKSIDRAEELAKLSPQSVSKPASVAEAAPSPAATKPRVVESAPERPATRAPDRSSSTHTDVASAPAGPRAYGAPVGEAPRQRIIPLDAPINAPPTLSTHRAAAPSASAGSAAPPMPSAAPAAAVDVVPAKILKRVTPIAPADIPRKTKGYVIVRFNIGADGHVSDLAVVESQPQGVFDQAAQDAVRKWTYEPRKENGVAVESAAKAKLVFDSAN